MATIQAQPGVNCNRVRCPSARWVAAVVRLATHCARPVAQP